MMKLYSAPLSLFSRKVEIALREKGVSFERVMVPFDQSVGYNPKHPDVLAANPKAQVPVLIDGDLTLYDSTIILEYLEEAYPKPALYPRSAADRARCRLLDLYADEIMLVPLRALMHRTGPRPDNPDVWTAAETKAKDAEGVIRRQFGELNRRLGGHAYFGGALTIADIALFMAVHFSLRLGGPTPNPHEALAGWYARLRARPAFANVVEEILKADLELSSPVEMGRD
jgi:glutathione S-transferase